MTAVVTMGAVGLTYPGPPSVRALLPTDFVVERGEYVTIMGPSGSGKSTFLNILGLLDRPTEGTFALDGIDVSSLRERQRAALRANRIGFVFQAFHLMPYRTATENVALAQLYSGVPLAKRMANARAALDRVGMSHRADALPKTLSGGERQRVAIARALAHGPSLLLCDEPTGNLDTTTSGSILELLDELHAAEMTLVVITHDPQVAARGQRKVTIRDGMLDE
ncbi:ABC transporter ATP-binding protein [Micromonospora profundi]|uniref:ABC transporter ATP-binding protein n=1 Tax=Micromonospora profundi TaxID=1420889 RepID=UPI00364C337D